MTRLEAITRATELSIEHKLLTESVYKYVTSLPNGFMYISFFGRKPTFFRKFDHRILIDEYFIIKGI